MKVFYKLAYLFKKSKPCNEIEFGKIKTITFSYIMDRNKVYQYHHHIYFNGKKNNIISYNRNLELRKRTRLEENYKFVMLWAILYCSII